MLSYLNNNFTLISKYQELYKNGINIDIIIEKFISGELLSNTYFDYARFRVFIDSCMLLFNKEKINNFLKHEFSFNQFVEKVKLNENFNSYINLIKDMNIIPNIDGIKLFYPFDNKKLKPWDQVAIIRNAIAHMQYGNFTH